ncbi:DUF502 domain-containing protein [Pannonibacter sp. Pt2]|uniref:DUF502 domain-containing protein n=2 Tax=Pannonibacter anstelovis TaxID=3121537 RepID=A0ABU7ZHN8_9HYPH
MPDQHQDTPARAHKSFGARLRNSFLAGLVIAGPVGITLWLTWSFIQWVDGLVKPALPPAYNPDTYLPFPVPGVGLIVAFTALSLTGFVAANFLGRTLIGYGERAVARMPLVRNLYNGLKQIFETVLDEKGASFKKAALIEYPRKGLFAIVFVATSAKGEVAQKLPGGGEEEYIAVFLPTTPNPTSGFLLYLPRKDVIELSMTVEDAAKLIISAGLITPEHPQIVAALPADTTKPKE